jgi:hypothetical protein
MVINSKKEIIPSGYFNKTSEDNGVAMGLTIVD